MSVVALRPIVAPMALSLNARLGALHEERRRSWDPAVLQINIDQRAELLAAADPKRWRTAGDAMPSAQLVDAETGPFWLHDRLAGGPVVLLFFRFAGCPACNIALPYYNDTLAPALRSRGVQLIGVSPQVPGRLIDIKRRHELDFAIASDPGNGLARRIGIAFTANAATQQQAQPGQPWLGETVGTGTWELPQPAVLVIGSDGQVVFIDVTPDWLHRTETETIIKAIDSAALQ